MAAARMEGLVAENKSSIQPGQWGTRESRREGGRRSSREKVHRRKPEKACPRTPVCVPAVCDAHAQPETAREKQTCEKVLPASHLTPRQSRIQQAGFIGRC